MAKQDHKKATRFVHSGRPSAGLGTPVSHSVTRASTLLFEKAEDLYRSDVRGYGRHGSEIHDALADLFTDLESGVGTLLYPCLLYTSPSPRDATLSRMPSSA